MMKHDRLGHRSLAGKYERLQRREPKDLPPARAIAERAAIRIDRPYPDRAGLLYDESRSSKMILDFSPLVSTITGEPDSGFYIQAIGRAPRCRISAGISWNSQPSSARNYRAPYAV